MKTPSSNRLHNVHWFNHAPGTKSGWPKPVWALAFGALVMVSSISVSAISGYEGTFEFGLDAPWRIEPQKMPNGKIEYGAIPIQVTIHDAMHVGLDDIAYGSFGGQTVSVHLPSSILTLGKVHSIIVKEIAPVERTAVEFSLKALHEIEMTTGAWPWPPDPAHPPTHKICRIWNGDDPTAFSDVSGTSEWHANLYYVPVNTTPGTFVGLQIEVILQRPYTTVPAVPLFPPFQAKLPMDLSSPLITLRNYARVFLAADPLPRFDNRWLYGDFHYHSQGTDNEGEAAYNYRGVLRAMGAMGLDFVFATDHASSSAQIIDADLPPYFDIARIAHDEGDKLSENDAHLEMDVLRDMDADRYTFCHSLIYDDKGANKEVPLRGFNNRFTQNYLTHGVIPQIFLGGEVDAIPEVSVKAVNEFKPVGNVTVGFNYGDRLVFDLAGMCSPKRCDPKQTILEFGGDFESFLVHDFQGVDAFNFYGREHMVYFPSSSSLFVGNELSFVASETSKYGGATRRLDKSFAPGVPPKEPLLPEFERKGVVFIAHHLNGGPTGRIGSGGGPGPDGVPWTTDLMLLKAFRSKAVLGMEFWNEDIRYHTRVCSHDFCRNGGDGSIYNGYELGYERHETLTAASSNPLEELGILVGDILGVDFLPAEYHNLALPLEEVRHGFITGGAAGGLFELRTFDPRTGLWDTADGTTESVLQHGAYDWDIMNLRGLDFENNTDLTWLPSAQPRRMFMGGGSDAHGDLGMRRAGYFLGTTDSTDAAIGKPRNLVFVGAPQGPVLEHIKPVATGGGVSATGTSAPVGPASVTPIVGGVGGGGVVGGGVLGTDIRPHTQEQIVQALQQGHFSVTDGPAIRMAVDTNGNGQIDDAEPQMGDVYQIPSQRVGPFGVVIGPSQKAVNLITEVESTTEFGPILKIDLYVGVHPGVQVFRTSVPVETRVYAPLNHGPSGSVTASDPNHPQISYVSHGRDYVRLVDDYWNGEFLGDTISWRQVPGDQLKFKITLATTLNLDKYEVGQGIPADRFFVRAFVRTAGNDLQDIPDRYAYTNPIWILRSQSSLGQANAGTPAAGTTTTNVPPVLTAKQKVSGKVIVNFIGVLQFAPSLDKPFQDVPDALTPYEIPAASPVGFFRCRQWQ